MVESINRRIKSYSSHDVGVENSPFHDISSFQLLQNLKIVLFQKFTVSLKSCNFGLWSQVFPALRPSLLISIRYSHLILLDLL
jgi:hypothetical protein